MNKVMTGDAKMKLLFLDIDGVLNSARSMTVLGGSGPRKDPTQVNLDPVAVGLLHLLCKECDLKVFVHSSWWGGRINKRYLTKAFRHYGWKQPRIVGGCRHGDSRADRIRAGLKQFAPTDFIILDDADMTKDFPHNAIIVNAANGFSFENYADALTHFGKKAGVFLI